MHTNIKCSCNQMGSPYCVDKNCSRCCNNKDCVKHKNSQQKTIVIAEDKSSNIEITQNVLNDYKFLFYSFNKNLPIEIINKIVDEYLDDRNFCITCKWKFDDDAYDMMFCDCCNECICDVCCNQNYDGYKIEYYCDDCYEELESESENENESDDNANYYEHYINYYYESDDDSYYSDIDYEGIIQRKNELLSALSKAGLEYRSDSRLYEQYIHNECNYSLDKIIEIMIEMKWYCNHTNYNEIMKKNYGKYKDKIVCSTKSKKEAYDNWCKNNKPDPQPPDSIIKNM